MDKLLSIASRVLIAQIFLISGFGKIAGFAGTQAYMASKGVPAALLPLVIALEVGGGLALVLGFKTRLVALALAVFSIGAALLFHTHFADQVQLIHFMKNLAMAGGLLLLVRDGAGSPSIDNATKA